jgi:hypothetical protein
LDFRVEKILGHNRLTAGKRSVGGDADEHRHGPARDPAMWPSGSPPPWSGPALGIAYATGSPSALNTLITLLGASASAGNWSSLTLNGKSDTSSGDNTLALAFNWTSQPRLLAPVQDNTFATNLNYWECNTSDCSTNANSWTTVLLDSPISGLAATYSSLRLTHSGEPRFAYYGILGSETLFYFWCSSACTNGAHWSHSSV